MINYKNLKISLFYPWELSKKIIRKHKKSIIVGIVDSSPFFLHKRKRFRQGGLFCEEVFGYIYICRKYKCRKIKFNKNLVLNRFCIKCHRKMELNYNRTYRMGAVFFNFPIFHSLYYKIFIELVQTINKLYIKFMPFDLYDANYTKNYKYLDVGQTTEGNGYIIVYKYLSFVNLFYKLFSTLKIFAAKLNVIRHYKESLFKALTVVNNNFINISFFKSIFIVLFPILPIGLRNYCFLPNRAVLNSKFNSLYTFIIDINNKLISEEYEFDYSVKHIFILFNLLKIILTHTHFQSIFNKESNIYSRLKGKYGIFRQNLLGFRVDYSGRSVIVSGPDLNINNVGVPVKMLQEVLNRKLKFNSIIGKVDEKVKIEKSEEEVADFCYKAKYLNVLDDLNYFSFIVNRAPTLHKMNTQSFCSIFSESKAIKFMPLLCAGYNADFDGDQMGVFSVLLQSSMLEASYILRPITNLISPTNKKIMFNLTQGALLGCYSTSTYNYFNKFNSYIINNYLTLIDVDINVNFPLLLRNNNNFYVTTKGRVLLNIKNILSTDCLLNEEAMLMDKELLSDYEVLSCDNNLNEK